MKKISCLFLVLLLLLTLNSSFAFALSDSTPPTIDEVKILTPVVKPGSKVKIQVKVSDDVSGTKDVALMFESPSANNNLHAFLYITEYEELSNTYVFESQEISRYAEIGNWNLILMTARDFAGNKISMHKIYYEEMKDLFFTVDPNAPSYDEEVDDGFKVWESKDNVEVNKEFTITFNTDFNIKTILEKNIYVQDANNNNIPLMFIIDRSTDLKSSSVTISPVGSYRRDSNYTLYIKDILSMSGKTLNENVKMKFSTTK